MSSGEKASIDTTNNGIQGLQSLAAQKTAILNGKKAENTQLVAEIAKLDKDLSAVNQNLNVGTLKGFGSLIWDNLVGVEDQDKDANLMIIPNNRLSRTDLERKSTILNAKMQEMREKQNALQAQIELLDQDIKRINQEIKHEIAIKNAKATLDTYQNNPDEFWRTVLLQNKGMILSAHPAEVYNSADQIMAVLMFLNENSDFKKLTLAWEIMTQARDIAEAQYKYYMENEKNRNPDKEEELKNYVAKYQQFAYKYFIIYVDYLPVELQALKIIYDKDPLRVDDYLNMLLAIQQNKNYDPANWLATRTKITAYQGMLDSLRRDVNEIYPEAALVDLRRRDGFNALPIDTQLQLVDQKVYVDKLRFDLDAVPAGMRSDAKIQELDALAATLESNVYNAIAEHQAFALNAQNFAEVQAMITAKERAVRLQVFADSVSQDVTNTKLGAGMGLSWLMSGTLASAIAAGSVAKAAVLASNAQVPALEQERELAAKMSAVDYKYLQELDVEILGADTAPVEITQPPMFDKIKDKISTGAKAKVQELIDSNVKPQEIRDQIDSALDRWNRTLRLTSASVVSVAMIAVMAVAIAIPALWPLAVALAGVLAISLAIMVVRDVVKTQSNVRDAVKSVGGMLGDGFKELGSAIARPFRALAALFTPVPEPEIVTQSKNMAAFTFDPQKLKEINELSPGFATPLMAYFNGRADKIREKIQQAQQVDPKIGNVVYDQALLQEAWSEYLVLQTDWKTLEDLIAEPATFCKYMKPYIKQAYKVARQEYEQTAQKMFQQEVTQDKPITMTMRNTLTPDFNMQFRRRFDQERAMLEQLRMLNQRVVEISRNC